MAVYQLTIAKQISGTVHQKRKATTYLLCSSKT
jgi:hypothetical protein